MAEPPQKISRKPFKKSSKNSVENKSTRFFFWRTRSGICEKVASESVCHFLLLWSFLCMSPKFHLKIFHILNIPYIRNILVKISVRHSSKNVSCTYSFTGFTHTVHPLENSLIFFFMNFDIFIFFETFLETQSHYSSRLSLTDPSKILAGILLWIP